MASSRTPAKPLRNGAGSEIDVMAADAAWRYGAIWRQFLD